MTGSSSVWRPENLSGDLFAYRPEFLDRADADALLERLWRELVWSCREIRLFGRTVLQPRLVAWYGDPGAVYRYSGLRLEPAGWHPDLARLRDRIEQVTGHEFKSVLANAYRDGRDSMGWHSDDERELGPEPVIASLSLGAPRRFVARPRSRSGGGRTRCEFLLEHGSLLLMGGRCQRDYQHAVPRTACPAGLRINLTYRWIQAPA
jgi:alkylated DNA repair dioxygenase AlkB